MTTIPCQWYVMCANPATIAVQHPIGLIPTCSRCADKHGLTGDEIEVVVTWCDVCECDDHGTGDCPRACESGECHHTHNDDDEDVTE